MEIHDDNTAVEGIKEKSRPAYIKAWAKFRLFQENSVEFETRIPTEQEFLTYFRHLRTEKGMASSTMWTTYSMINSTIKGKHGSSLKIFPRVISLLKSYDTDIKHKADIFSTDEVQIFVNNKALSGAYWLVRKAVVVLAFFGGLRHCESMNLVLERFSSTKEGVYVMHERAKQRSDKQNSKFLVPRATAESDTDYAGIVESYLSQVKDDLGKYTGMIFICC